MCRVLGVSKSGFYGWSSRDHEGKESRRRSLVDLIYKAHLGGRRNYGSPRVFKVLKGMGVKVGKTKVERLMRENGIRAKGKRKFRATTDSNHPHPVVSNKVQRNFAIGTANRVWCGDITYLWTPEGWLYLAAIIDLGTRKIVGWSMDENMTADLVTNALHMALQRQNPPPGLMFHSDRGTQYACHAFKRVLEMTGIEQSMSRKGDCFDNAVMESFFHTLKVEYVYDARPATRKEARAGVFEYVEAFYNRERLHSTLGYQSPECYERQLLAQCA